MVGASIVTPDLQNEDRCEDALLPRPDSRSADASRRFFQRFGTIVAVAAASLLVLAVAARVASAGHGLSEPSGARVLADMFDCSSGDASWKKGWSGMKKQWCCRHQGIHCEQTENGQASVDDEPFDCESGLNDWDLSWAVPKKLWCCRNKGLHCGNPNELKVTWVFGNIDYQRLHSSAGLQEHFKNSVEQTIRTTLRNFHIGDIEVIYWEGSALHSSGTHGKTPAGIVVHVEIELKDISERSLAEHEFNRDLFKMRATRGITGVTASISSGSVGTHNVAVEQSIAFACTCENGEPAIHPPDCSPAGGNRCRNCSAGFHLTRRYQCEENVCVCHGGKPATDDACPVHQEMRCISCFVGRHFDPLTNTCIANDCRCSMGWGADGLACTQHNALICGQCFEGYEVDDETKACVPKECVCPDGTPVDIKDCPRTGEHKCSKCDVGFHLDPDDFQCKVNICRCARGNPAVGPNCHTHRDNICASCEADLFLQDGICSGDKLCQCPHGTPVSGTKCTTNFGTICQRCDVGFQLAQEQCVAARCECENGVAELDADCQAQGGAVCKECDDGYRLDMGKCVPRQCTCFNGKAATGLSCVSEGAAVCTACDEGYHQQLLNVRVENDDVPSRLNVLCVPNTCTCQDDNGTRVGLVPEGETQAMCHHDGANFCIRCNSHYQGPDRRGRCIANECECPHGEPVGVRDCHKDGLTNCRSCHTGYWVAKDHHWKVDPNYQGAHTKESYEAIWARGGSVCVPQTMTTVRPFDCSAGQETWELGWSREKQNWCCEHENIGCMPVLRAKEACEQKGFTYDQCVSVGCCRFIQGQCQARAGWELQVCRPFFKIYSESAAKCLQATVDERGLSLVLCDSADSRQEWRPSDPHRIHNGVGKCLAVASKSLVEPVVLKDCNSDSLQSFQFDGDSKLIQLVHTNFCISDDLRLQDCDLTSTTFKWDVAVLAA